MKPHLLTTLIIFTILAITTSSIKAFGATKKPPMESPWTFSRLIGYDLTDKENASPKKLVDLIFNIYNARNLVIKTEKACKAPLENREECTELKKKKDKQKKNIQLYYPNQSKLSKGIQKIFSGNPAGIDRITYLIEKIENTKGLKKSIHSEATSRLRNTICKVKKGEDFLKITLDKKFRRINIKLPKLKEELDLYLKLQILKEGKLVDLIRNSGSPNTDAEKEINSFCSPSDRLHNNPSGVSSDLKKTRIQNIIKCQNEKAPFLNSSVPVIDAVVYYSSMNNSDHSPTNKIPSLSSKALSRIKDSDLSAALGAINLGNTCFANAAHVIGRTLFNTYPDLYNDPSELNYAPPDTVNETVSSQLAKARKSAYRKTIRLFRKFNENFANLRTRSKPLVKNNYHSAELNELFVAHDSVLRIRNQEEEARKKIKRTEPKDLHYFRRSTRTNKLTYLRKHQQDPKDYLNDLLLENVQFSQQHGFERVTINRNGSVDDYIPYWDVATGVRPSVSNITVSPSTRNENHTLQELVDTDLKKKSEIPPTGRDVPIDYSPYKNGDPRDVLVSRDGKLKSILVDLVRNGSNGIVDVFDTLTIDVINPELVKNAHEDNKTIEGITNNDIITKKYSLSTATIYKPGSKYGESGHYYAYDWDSASQRWLRYNDHKVEWVTESEAKKDINSYGTLFLFKEIE